MESTTALGITGGTGFAQIALLLLGYAVPAAPQWLRAAVAYLVGTLTALAAALRGGMAALTLLAALQIAGQGLLIAGFALGLLAGAGVVQHKRTETHRVTARGEHLGAHGTKL